MPASSSVAASVSRPSSSRSVASTAAPAAPRPAASQRPMPPAAPVTTATLPASEKSMPGASAAIAAASSAGAPTTPCAGAPSPPSFTGRSYRTPNDRLAPLEGASLSSRSPGGRLRLRERGRRRVRRQVAVLLGAVAARNGDVELGVAPHAVLGHVQPGRLHLRLGADADRVLHQPEDAEGDAE